MKWESKDKMSQDLIHCYEDNYKALSEKYKALMKKTGQKWLNCFVKNDSNSLEKLINL